MTGENQWRARLSFQRWPGELTPEQLSGFVQALPGFGIMRMVEPARVDVDMTVTAPTARTAYEAALRALRAAYARVIGGGVDVTGARVMTEAEWERELRRPPQMDLVGLAEIAELLKVSTQRAGELARTHPAFPEPVATLKMGPVYTRASVEAFDQGWERKPGRPRKTG